ncbi:MAG: hypothetical protein ABI700_26320 [Chloroflexota bacterium]
MGILTDFVVADISEAQRIGESLNPSRDFNGLDAKGIDQVKLAMLYAILSDQPYDPDFMSAESLLYAASDDGPWVQQVPPDLVSRLANLSDSDYPAITHQWAQTEEFTHKHSGYSPAAALERTEGFLRRIAPLARQSIAENKALLMWMCL